MTKRSVATVKKLYYPIDILSMAKRAYEQDFIPTTSRLMYACLVCLLYLGGFRINEALRLRRLQFKVRSSLEEHEFLVVEGAEMEKAGGKMRNCAICPSDPLSIPLQARLKELELSASASDVDSYLFASDAGSGGPITDRTARRICDRISEREVWPHLFRSARDSFLAVAFSKDERKSMMGWSGGGEYRGGGKKFRDIEDRYAFLNWMTYADRLAKLTENYWKHQAIPDEINAWLVTLGLQ